MPLALATALRSHLIIFTTDPENPQMYVTPDIEQILGTMFLVYNPFGPGHYDVALRLSQP